MTVPEAVPQQVRMLHCSTCGGRLPGQGDRCQFCAARPAPGDLERGTLCPRCFARIRDGARFCDTCGVEIAVEAVVKAISDHTCPRCETDLMLHEGVRDSFYSCPNCQGIWLSKQAFDRFVDDTRPDTPVRFPEPLPKDIAALKQQRSETKEREAPRVRCPVCSGVMHRFDFGSYWGAAVDQCRSHGFWFDVDELAPIGAFISKGGLDWAKERRSRRRRLFQKQRARMRRQQREHQDSGVELLSGIGLALMSMLDD